MFSKEKLMKIDLHHFEEKFWQEINSKEKTMIGDLKSVNSISQSISEKVSSLEVKHEKYEESMLEVKATQLMIDGKLDVLDKQTEAKNKAFERMFKEMNETIEQKLINLDTRMTAIESRIEQSQGIRNIISKEKLECSECGKSFPVEFHYKNHLLSKHKSSSKIAYCSICNKKFPNSHHLEGHMKKEHKTFE